MNRSLAVMAIRILVLLAAVPIGSNARPAAAGIMSWTTLQDPYGSNSALATAIDGSNVVGYQTSPGTAGGFLFNGSSWTYLSEPGAAGEAYPAVATGISGANVVGYSGNSPVQAFLYSTTSNTWTTLTAPFPGLTRMEPTGISGSDIVGYYETGSNTEWGFLYNGQTWTSLTGPTGALTVDATAVSGNLVTGEYTTAGAHSYGFVYNISTSAWTTLPNVPKDMYGGIDISGISANANELIGSWNNGYQHGFLYNLTTDTWTSFDDPLATLGTFGGGISGNTIDGTYYVGQNSYPFVATIPEPASVALFAIGGLALTGILIRRRSRDGRFPGPA